MTATIHKLPAKKPKLQCSKCGAKVEAGCGCGVAYVPLSEKAAAAIKAQPHKSNRAISAETGISEPTIRRARTASHDAVEKRVGLDGKARRLPAKPDIEDEPIDVPDAFTMRQRYLRALVADALIAVELCLIKA
jgi:hypothetical protein